MSLEIKIVNATINIFKEKGVKFTMDDIATKLGVSKRTLYENVDSKECLLNLIVDTVFDSIAEESKQIINDQNIDDIERVKKEVSEKLDFFKEEVESKNISKNSIKNTRINSEVQRELSSIISRELKDPRIHPMTTVVSVEVTPDLKYCKAYISVLGNEEAAKDTIQGLKSAVGFVRTQLAKRINLRNTPEITFILDQSIEYGVHMTRLIDEVTENLRDSESGDEEENE